MFFEINLNVKNTKIDISKGLTYESNKTFLVK